MDYNTRKSLCTFMDEERKAKQSPPRLSFKSFEQISDRDLNYSHSRSSSTAAGMYSLMPPPSPDSPWTLSPLQTPSPSVLYHCIASLHRHEGIIYSIAVSRGIVYTGSESSRICAWRQPDCTERGYIKANCGEVHCVSCMGYYHAEGLLYTGSWDKTVKAWRVSDGKCVDSFLAHEDSVNAIVINQEDGCVFTCSSDGSVKIWRRVYDQSSHTLTMTLKFQPSPVNALALSTSHSSCFLYSGSSDGFINFWEKEKMSSRFNHGGFLQGHRFAVLSLVAIEKLIFSGSEDTTIRIWRREEGSYYHECLAVLDAHRGPVRCLAACLEVDKLMVIGFLVYSAGLDQTFKLWRVKVLPDEKNVCMEGTGRSDKMRITEYEMSPVLSPSWVEKKRQGNPT
ncbi:unnamed protein product [Coffea canephora]|uniref:Uncharacterized protein n=1 Tax=Coffea canephora TaxID=49390 RepID=A0A068V6H3_COFCA|nr:unnamed protein product [Coffea canephora]